MYIMIDIFYIDIEVDIILSHIFKSLG